MEYAYKNVCNLIFKNKYKNNNDYKHLTMKLIGSYEPVGSDKDISMCLYVPLPLTKKHYVYMAFVKVQSCF
jgi:hypothetical protein